MKAFIQIQDGKEVYSGEVELKKTKKRVSASKQSESKSKKQKEGLPERLNQLIEENFFKKPRTAGDIKKELKLKGFTHSLTHIRVGLLRLIRKRKIRRIKEKGEKTYSYVNY